MQTGAQKLAFEQGGFEEYLFIMNGAGCERCSDINGKHFKVSEMEIGKNAPPLHPNCRCSIAPYEDSAEYDEWLEHLENGGTTEEWENQKAVEKDENDDIIRAGIGKAGSNFTNPHELLYQYAKKIVPEKDFDDVICHANPNSFEIDLEGNGNPNDFIEISPEEFAEILLNSNSYKGRDIRIISCQAGANPDGAAQRLANALGVKVKAPTEIVNVDENGNIFVSDNDILAEMWHESTDKSIIKETGKWIVFEPERRNND